MSTRRRLARLVLAVSVIGAATLSYAGTVSGRVDVTAVVNENCRLTVPPLSFGSYDPLLSNYSQPNDASVVVVVTCTRNTPAALSFDFGLHAASTSNRAMSGPGTDNLQYQIYRDSARSQIWGRGTDAYQFLAKGIAQPEQITVFGRIPPQQEVQAGTYSDSLTAAVDF